MKSRTSITGNTLDYVANALLWGVKICWQLFIWSTLFYRILRKSGRQFCFWKTNLRCVVTFFWGAKRSSFFESWKLILNCYSKNRIPSTNCQFINWCTMRNWSILRIKSNNLFQKELKCGNMNLGMVFNFTKLTTHLLAVVKFSVSNRLQFKFSKNWRPI